jgi:hypothetical protein
MAPAAQAMHLFGDIDRLKIGREGVGEFNRLFGRQGGEAGTQVLFAFQ